MCENHSPPDTPEERERDDPADEAPAAPMPSGADPVVVSIGQDLTVADYQAMEDQAAGVRSLAEQLRAILRCPPDDLPL